MKHADLICPFQIKENCDFENDIAMSNANEIYSKDGCSSKEP